MEIDDTTIDGNAQPPTAADPAVRRLLADAEARARFFRGPAGWLETHATRNPALIEAYARALAHELGEPTPPRSLPTWLDDVRRATVPTLAPPAGSPLPDEIRMGAAVIAVTTLAAVLVVAMVATAATSAVSTQPPPPVPKPKLR